MSDNLKERVQQFNALELPGQPMMMHMGTSYLVRDLWGEIERLRAINAELVEMLKEIAENPVRPGRFQSVYARESIATTNPITAAIESRQSEPST